MPGNDTTALLSLAPYVNYQFRVVSVNAVGRSQPSKPSLRYATPPAGKHGSGFRNSIFRGFFGISVPSRAPEGVKESGSRAFLSGSLRDC